MVNGFLSLVLKLMGKSWLPGAVLERALALPRRSGTEPMADQPRLMQAVPEKTQQVRQLLSARSPWVLPGECVLWSWIHDPEGHHKHKTPWHFTTGSF